MMMRRASFIQLLKHYGKEDEDICQWLKKKSNKYISHEIQNSLIKSMALSVIRKVTEKLYRSPFLAVMIDDTIDMNIQEHVTLVVHIIENYYEVNEEFIGLYAVPRIDSATLISVIKDTLTRQKLSFHNIRGQCYDGCSTMSGSRNGLLNEFWRSLCSVTHCYCHALNLAANDAIDRVSAKYSQQLLIFIKHLGNIIGSIKRY